MNILNLDIETAYGKHPTTGDYVSLKGTNALTTEHYLRHPLFKCFGVGLQMNGGERIFVPDGETLDGLLAKINWEDTALLCHHAHFDGAWLHWHKGYVPAMYLCTMSMARVITPTESVGLGRQAEIHGFGTKGDALLKTKDKWELTQEEWDALAAYCAYNDDSDLGITWNLWEKFKIGFPINEIRLIDLTVRMFTDPVLEIEGALCEQEVIDEQTKKAGLIAKTGYDAKTIASNKTFATLLQGLGITPPVKWSPAALKRGEKVETFAFAKADEEFIALLTNDNPAVCELVEARLAVKSTINETRARRMAGISKRGAWPVYLNYAGAKTTARWSGGDKVNPQNFKRGSSLRQSIHAPEGWSLIVSDLAQIEARVLAWLAGQDRVLKIFADEGDVYSMMASTIFGRPIDRKRKELCTRTGEDIYPEFIEGFIGKATVLGCGYGVGWRKFQEMIRIGMLGGPSVIFDETYVATMGVNVDHFTHGYHGKLVKWAVEHTPYGADPEKHIIHCAVAKHIIDTFRLENVEIVRFWNEMEAALRDLMLENYGQRYGVGGLIEGIHDGLFLHSRGAAIKYSGLTADFKNGRMKDFRYKKAKKTIALGYEKVYLYGGKVVENVVQAIARDIIGRQKLQIADNIDDVKIVMSSHDEVLVLARENKAREVYSQVIQIMSIAPPFMPGLPLMAEGGVAQSYGEAK